MAAREMRHLATHDRPPSRGAYRITPLKPDCRHFITRGVPRETARVDPHFKYHARPAHHERSRRVGTFPPSRRRPASRLPRGALRAESDRPIQQRTRGAAIVGASGARARRAVPLRATASSSRADGDALDRVPRAFDPVAVVEDPIPAADAEPPPRGGARRSVASPRPRSASRSSSPPSPRL